MPREKQPTIDEDPDTGRTSVLIEPASDIEASQVRKEIASAGGTQVEEVAPGFISAEVPTTKIEVLKRLGRVNIVPRKRLR
jgi:hypothetical protein